MLVPSINSRLSSLTAVVEEAVAAIFFWTTLPRCVAPKIMLEWINAMLRD